MDENVLWIIFCTIFAFFIGIIGGWAWCANTRVNRLKEVKKRAKNILNQAEQDAETASKAFHLEARESWRKEQEPIEREFQKRSREQEKHAADLNSREQQLNRKFDILDNKEQILKKKEEILSQQEIQLIAANKHTDELQEQHQQRIEKLAGLSQPEAREIILNQLEESTRLSAAKKIRSITDEAMAKANLEAREIITRSIHKFSGKLATESTVSMVDLPSDDMKGRIIGRDGRNIRSFEMITGVEIIVDETPGVVMLSGFDPLRREIAKITLEKLILDGRIHPGRIEEIHEKALQDVDEITRESGSKAAFDLGIHDMDEHLIESLGKLRFHTSYGQNLLAHSKEVGFIAGMMAEALDLDIALARRVGLLHEIGNSLTSETGSNSKQLGASIARKYGESQKVVHTMETYEKNSPSRSAIATLVDAANEISICRPGAQKDKAEEYTQRLKHIEKLAETQPGVRKAYALQNGKEIRVLVDSGILDDSDAEQLAEDFSEILDNEVDNIGQIRVCVIREIRSTHFAR